MSYTPVPPPVAPYRSAYPTLTYEDGRATPESTETKTPSLFMTRSLSPLKEIPAPPALSRWGVGWTTTFMMGFFYVLAFIVATFHFALFTYLHGRSADKGIPQTYVTTSSSLLAYAFASTLNISLAVAFTQHLWLILRRSATKTSTIEVLFSMRSNPFALLNLRAIKKSWVLVLLAFLLYVLPIATSFPPGALTVTSSNPTKFNVTSVPTFNASFVGNGTVADAQAVSIPQFNIGLRSTGNSKFEGELISASGLASIPSLQSLATEVIVSGNPIPMRSPCGANCSYTIQFEGPIFQCESTAITTRVQNITGFGQEVDDVQEAETLGLSLQNGFDASGFPRQDEYFQVPLVFFSGSWNVPGGVRNFSPPNSSVIQSQSVYTEDSYTVTTLNTSQLNFPNFTLTETNFTCIPSRTTYTVTNSYIDNVQNLTYTTSSSSQLINTVLPENVTGTVHVPPKSISNTDLHVDWTKENLQWFSDCQLMALTQQIGLVFTGDFETSNIIGVLDGVDTVLQQTATGDGSAAVYLQNSRLSTSFQKFTQAAVGDESNTTFSGDATLLSVSVDDFNKMLGDLTVSTMSTYQFWTENANTSQFPSENIYTFSKPINLILPYFVSLGISLPFVFLGIYSLYKNGVPAADGGFMQILTTTTGSPMLQKAAAGNCLSGVDVSTELEDLEVQFGELVNMQSRYGGKWIRRAGFGTKDEIEPLVKGENYGYH